MLGLINKIAARLKIKFHSTGFTRIKSGLAKGIIWSHAVSDARYLTGFYEPELAAWLVKSVKSGKSFIDVGANAGYFSLMAEKYCTRADQKIIAVEPLPFNLNLIHAHLVKNQSTRIKVINCALSSSHGEVEFSDSGNPSANTYMKESSLYKSYPKIEVKTITLDHLVRENNLHEFVVKIDVEGAELDVLKGAEKLLQDYKPELILATHDCHVPGVEKACMELLALYGYKSIPLHEVKEVGGQKDYLCYMPDSI